MREPILISHSFFYFFSPVILRLLIKGNPLRALPDPPPQKKPFLFHMRKKGRRIIKRKGVGFVLSPPSPQATTTTPLLRLYHTQVGFFLLRLYTFYFEALAHFFLPSRFQEKKEEISSYVGEGGRGGGLNESSFRHSRSVRWNFFNSLFSCCDETDVRIHTCPHNRTRE